MAKTLGAIRFKSIGLVAAIVGISLVLLSLWATSRIFVFEVTTGPQNNLLSPEVYLRPWREKVLQLQGDVASLELEIRTRDAKIAELLRISDNPTAAAAAADAAAATMVPRTPASPPPAAGSEAHHEAAPWAPAWASASAWRFHASSGIDQVKELQAQGLSHSGAGSLAFTKAPQCTFESDQDYTAVREEMVEKHTVESCCDLCIVRNAIRAGSCEVAVLSGPMDKPPHACWVKAGVGSAFPKVGVQACFPPGSKRPSGPRAGPSQEEEQHLQALASLVAPVGGVSSADLLRQRANAIRDAARHAWSSYRRIAWGFDELKPVSGKGFNSKYHHAITMVDSLDTLWLLGLKDEFAEAREWLVTNLPKKLQSMPGGASLFETTIRTFGGLLSTYDLTGDRAFIDLALPLANRISSKIQPNGLTPYTFQGGKGGSGCPSLVESGTYQLEMRYLSHVTGDASYATKASEFYNTIRNVKGLDGLWPNCWQKGRGKISFGADGDSFYEYLLKTWLQGGRSERHLRDMFDAAADGLEKHLVQKGEDGLTYLHSLVWTGGEQASLDGSRVEPDMEHLSCFVPGWLMLGMHDAPESPRKERLVSLARDLAYTCWQMYDRQPTKIGPERVKGMMMDLSRTDTREYILRPEAIESWWYMHELTKDPQYREWGWTIFQAFEKWLKVTNGYASLKDVRRGGTHIDRMESFFLAETLKYLFLLQDPDHPIRLDRYVLNTEAHPLSMLEFAPKLPPQEHRWVP